MMKTALALVLLFAASADARDLRPEIVVQGRVKGISLAPGGTLWITTAMGYAYRSDDGGRSWYEADVTGRKMTPESFRGDHLDRITFFDDRRAVISGYIGEDTDQVLLTADGGATWTRAQLPDGMWLYDAQALPDGNAWAVGSEGAVLHSADYGRTWRKLTRPFDSDERTMSVWFESPSTGIVGSMSGGELALTYDGGRRWQPFAPEGGDEVRKGCEGAHDARIDKARMALGRVVVSQCGGVFAAPVAAPHEWERLTADGKPLTDFELRGDGSVVGVTSERELVEIGPEGTRPLGMRLERHPLSLAVSGTRIALVDPTSKVTVFDGEKWFASRMFGKGVATSWPIASMDRAAEDVLWGVSEFFLYRSGDGGKTWDRVTEMPAAASPLGIQSNGDVLLADGHGWVGRWEVAASRLSTVPVLNGLDVTGSFRRRDVWLAIGGRQYDTAGRVEVAQTFFSGQFAGSVDHGFVAASTDGGRTWAVIDRWQEEGPQALFLSDDNRLTLLSWLGGVRQGTIALDPLSAKMQTLLRGEERDDVPYVQQTLVIDLLDRPRGWILGWIHHVGNVAHRTADGGRTWKRAEAEDYPRLAVYRLYDGTWAGLVPPSTVQRWTGRRWEPFARFDGEVQQAWVDSQGALMARLQDGTIQVLDAGKKVFRTVE